MKSRQKEDGIHLQRKQQEKSKTKVLLLLLVVVVVFVVVVVSNKTRHSSRTPLFTEKIVSESHILSLIVVLEPPLNTKKRKMRDK